jgi:penicillin-binding protein 1A
LQEALVDVPPVPFRAPPGVMLVRVNHKTGLPSSPGDKSAIMEAFKPGQAPAGAVPAEGEGAEMVQDGGPPFPGEAPPQAGPPPGFPPPQPGFPPPAGNDRALTSGTGGLY